MAGGDVDGDGYADILMGAVDNDSGGTTAGAAYLQFGPPSGTLGLGSADGVFIGSGIFKSGNPAQRAAACVKATTFYNDPKVVADVSRGLGDAMVGINVADIPVPHRLAERGW